MPRKQFLSSHNNNNYQNHATNQSDTYCRFCKRSVNVWCCILLMLCATFTAMNLYIQLLANASATGNANANADAYFHSNSNHWNCNPQQLVANEGGKKEAEQQQEETMVIRGQPNLLVAETKPDDLLHVPLVVDPCEVQYQQTVVQTRTPGLTEEDMQRSRAFRGNEWRLSNLARKLNHQIHSSSSSSNGTTRSTTKHPQPVTAIVSGGSISLGHGVVKGLRYSDRLEHWLNTHYTIPPNTETQQDGNGKSNSNSKTPRHTVLNKGSHGADVSIRTITVSLSVFL